MESVSENLWKAFAIIQEKMKVAWAVMVNMVKSSQMWDVFEGQTHRILWQDRYGIGSKSQREVQGFCPKEWKLLPDKTETLSEACCRKRRLLNLRILILKALILNFALFIGNQDCLLATCRSYITQKTYLIFHWLWLIIFLHAKKYQKQLQMQVSETTMT